jgi:TonB family protein
MAAVAMVACGEGKRGLSLSRLWQRNEPVDLPVLLTTELPFRYPPGLYLQQIQDDVTLQMYLDASGRVVSESTKVSRHARYAAFDSAALEGAPQLVFRPARRGETAIPFAVLFPIKFRVPNAPPLPQDTARDSVRK